MIKTEQHLAFEKWITEWGRMWSDDESWPDLRHGEPHHDASGYQCGETRLMFTCWNAALDSVDETRIRQEVIEECVQTCLKLHNSMLEAGNVICSNGVTHCITALHALKEAPCQSEK